MDDFGKFVTLALALLTLATAMGFGLQRGRITQLQGQLEDSDKEMARKTRRETELTTEVATLKADLAALTRVVTGEAHWIAIGDRLEDHHTEARQHWANDEGLLREIRDRLSERRS